LSKEKHRKELAKQVQQYVARGGVIKHIPYGMIADPKKKFMKRKPTPILTQFEDI
jgi:hypothetical protein|tara:strand:- start:2401 stop:2565 length:165 start_codon:yes stop_codon:yes gene_type:complete